MSCRNGWRWREDRTKAGNCLRTIHLGDQTEFPTSFPHYPTEKLRLRERQQEKHLQRAHRMSSARPQERKSLGPSPCPFGGRSYYRLHFTEEAASPERPSPTHSEGSVVEADSLPSRWQPQGTCLGSTEAPLGPHCPANRVYQQVFVQSTVG